MNNTTQNKPLCMNVWPDLGKALGVSRPLAYQLVHTEGFPTIRVGKKLLVSVAGLDRWIEKQTAGGTTQV